MDRIIGPHATRAESLRGCYWTETASIPPATDLPPDRVEVAVVGAGYTGLSAALTLAQAGLRVAVLDARQPGWGASGRNGGFCCRGGAMMGQVEMTRRFGAAAAAEWDRTEKAAVDRVADLIDTHGIACDRHSDGEMVLAHGPRAARRMGAILDMPALADLGISGPWSGGRLERVGFALNPRKYLAGLLRAARQAGVSISGDVEVRSLTGAKGGWQLLHEKGMLWARKIIVATNGYASERLPPWIGGRYLPVQSSIMVTRPLTDAELSAQGWTSDLMCYDTRRLLHYFRLLPERRFLFGMRGGIRATAASDARIQRAIRADFDAYFPAWRDVETSHFWTGLACLTRSRLPFAGQVPDAGGLFAAFGWHGNGIAMGTYAGALLARLMLGEDMRPGIMRQPIPRFPFGRWRRLLLYPAYAAMSLQDRAGC